MSAKQLIFFLFLLSSIRLSAQVDSTEVDENDETFSWAKPRKEGRYKLGVKMGLQLSSLLGGEMDNQRVLAGICGGAYGRLNSTNQKWSLQTDVLVGFRGSNFNHPTNGSYSTIKLLYFDFPFVLYHRFGEEHKHALGLGLQLSLLSSANMYFSNIQVANSTKPDLKKSDWLPLLSYQYRGNWIGFQFSCKYGLINQNTGKVWPNNGTPLNSGKEIRNFTTELTLMF